MEPEPPGRKLRENGARNARAQFHRKTTERRENRVAEIVGPERLGLPGAAGLTGGGGPTGPVAGSRSADPP